MANYVSAHIVTSANTEMWLHSHADQGFVVVGLGDRHGSELRMHLRPAEIDRLAAVLDQARRALLVDTVSAVA